MSSTEAKHRVIRAFSAELRKIAAAMPDPESGSMQQDAIDADLDPTPSHAWLAAHVQALNDKNARGIASVAPPPGYIYRPDLQQFVPDMQDPGWMTQPEAMQAESNQAAYTSGMQQGQAEQAAAQQPAASPQYAPQAEQQQSASQAEPQPAPRRPKQRHDRKVTITLGR